MATIPIAFRSGHEATGVRGGGAVSLRFAITVSMLLCGVSAATAQAQKPSLPDDLRPELERMVAEARAAAGGP